jgi:MoaA/NifB/PqqE/SkfB family radical SAM enzyme
MELHKKVLEQYAETRSGTFKEIVCHAPFVSLNFEQNGNVRACCYNNKDILGKWPTQSLIEIWQGEKANQLRKHIRDNNLGSGCKECGNMIVAGNYQGVRAKFFDEYAPNNLFSRIHYFRNKISGHIDFPKVLEFELSNECNLECVMCNGYFSSSIRKNREGLPPIVSPYNDQFVDELEQFIPHITDAKFLGGEPFMIKIYVKIWERILKINPSVRIHITTNGTLLTQRIKDLLEGLNAGIIISVDSLNEETYKKIRINGNFQKVQENIEYLLNYTKKKKTFMSLAACPITHNWKELPELLCYCLEKNITLYFNAVFSPPNVSLKEQSLEYQQEVIEFLEDNPPPERKGNPQSPRNLSISAYIDFIKQLKLWLQESKEKKSQQVSSNLSSMDANFSKQFPINWTLPLLFEKVKILDAITQQGYIDKENQFLNEIANLFVAIPPQNLAEVFAFYLSEFSNKTFKPEKPEQIAEIINQHNWREKILIQMSNANPKVLAENLANMEIDEMAQRLTDQFG